VILVAACVIPAACVSPVVCMLCVCRKCGSCGARLIRVPGWAAYTKVGRKDRTKLSSLHRSGNRKLLQVENRISNYTFVAQKWEQRVKYKSRDYIY
jgi:hypothetical protein